MRLKSMSKEEFAEAERLIAETELALKAAGYTTTHTCISYAPWVSMRKLEKTIPNGRVKVIIGRKWESEYILQVNGVTAKMMHWNPAEVAAKVVAFEQTLADVTLS